MNQLLIKTITGIYILFFTGISYAKDIDVYLIGGQSNATGQGFVKNIPQTFKADTTVLFFYSRYLKQGIGSEKWQPLCPASETKDKFGVELSLGSQLKKYFPNQEIALIKHGLAGSNLYQQWNPGNKTNSKQGTEYKKWLTTVKKAISELKEKGFNPIIRAMVWQQGEGDALKSAGKENSEKYGENLRNLILEIRKELKAPDMLFVYGEVMPMKAERFTGRELVRQGQIMVSEMSGSPLSVKNTFLVEGDDLQMRCTDYQTTSPKDDVHLGTYGILTLGERFAKTIYENYKK